MNKETYPAWSSVNEVPTQYKWLDEDIDCGVCVVGGGLTGAMCAMRLAESGEDVVLITEHQIGYSATADCSPLAQYDFGQHIIDIKKRIGLDNALRVLELGSQSIAALENLSETLDGDFGFSRSDTLLYTNDERELELFNREFLLRRHNGFDCMFLSRSTAADVFPFPMAGGILSKNLGARFDPYRLTQLCVKRAADLGARIYENTKVEALDSSQDTVVIDTSTRKTVFCDCAVLALGSGFKDIMSINANVRTGFYAVSEPVSGGVPGGCIVSTWAQPGVTLSAAPDGRIYCGGLETGTLDEKGRFCGVLSLPSLFSKRFDEIRSSIACHFPDAGVPQLEFYRSVRYIEAFDQMPVIGFHESHDKCFFACCTGPGAAPFSVIAGEMCAQMLSGSYTDDEAIFSPMRFSMKKAKSR